jgi:hypothetical protein
MSVDFKGYLKKLKVKQLKDLLKNINVLPIPKLKKDIVKVLSDNEDKFNKEGEKYNIIEQPKKEQEKTKIKPPTLAQQKRELKLKVKQPEDMTKEELIEAYRELDNIIQQQAKKKQVSFGKKILKKTGLKKLTPDELEQLSKEADYTQLLESRTALLGDKKITLQKHQKRFIEGFLYSNLKSAIMFHGVGTGKTFSAVGCVKSYLQIYPQNKVMIITPPALLFNFIDSMIDYGIDPRDKRFSYYSYVSFTNKKIDTTNSLMIIDEAHNMRTQIEYTETDTGKVERIYSGKRPYEAILRGANAHKVMLMTATPFINKPYDIENLLAIGDGRVSYNEEIFGTMVSDPQVRYDYFKYRISKFMNPINSEDFPDKIEKYVPIVIERATKDADRIYAMANRKTNPAYVYTRQASIDIGDGAKLKFIQKKLSENPTKKYVIYVSFHYAINDIEDALDKMNEKAVIISGRVSTLDKATAIDTYNNYDNENSEYYKKSRVMIISKAGAEGVSLTETRGIFVMDGVWNEALYVQIVARAIRYKSHANLPKEERYVEVYKLFNCFPNEAKILEKLNGGGKFNYKKFLDEFIEYKAMLARRKKQDETFDFRDLERSKKGSSERKQILQNMKYAKGRAGYVSKDIVDSFGGVPSTDFYMFVLQKSKQDVIDKLLTELEQVPELEKIITDMPEIQKLYKMVQKAYKKGDIVDNETIIKKLQSILGKEEAKAGLKLERAIDAKDSQLSQYLGKKKELTSLLKAKIKRRIKQEFFTPTKYVKELIQLSGLHLARKDRIYNCLETSAGWGNIVKGVIEVAEKKKLNIDFDLVEIQEENRKELKQIQDIIPHMVQLQKEPDFIQFLSSKKYDYVFTNPPFHLQQKYNKQYNQDVYSYHFIMRAYAMLKPLGILVAITGREWEQSDKAKEFYKEVGAKTINVSVNWSDDKALKKGMEISKLDITFIRIDKLNENPILDNKLIELTNKLVKDEERNKDKLGESLKNIEKEAIKDIQEEDLDFSKQVEQVKELKPPKLKKKVGKDIEKEAIEDIKKYIKKYDKEGIKENIPSPNLQNIKKYKDKQRDLIKLIDDKMKNITYLREFVSNNNELINEFNKVREEFNKKLSEHFWKNRETEIKPKEKTEKKRRIRRKKEIPISSIQTLRM